MPRGISRYDERLLQQVIPRIGQQVVNYPNINDPYFSNVLVSLHGNGLNGGLQFLDSSAFNRTMTASGDAQTSTAQSRWNGSSMLFDGTGDFLTSTNWPGIAANEDCTVEAWVRFSSLPNLRMILSDLNASSANSSMYWCINSTTMFAQMGTSAATEARCAISLAVDTWHHLAVVRSSNTVSMYTNGSSQTVTNATQAGAWLTGSSTLYVGRWGGTTNYNWNGNLADIRVTRGVARYTANFTVPNAPFPDFGS